MSQRVKIEDLDLSDSELITVLKNHGMSRRLLMKVFGAGAVASALSGTAAGKTPGGASIDEIYGATYFAGENVPTGLVDHVVELHAHDEHEDFPLDEEGVEEDEFFFDPVGLHVEPGDVVQFNVHGPVTHTVTSFHPYYEGLPPRVPTEDPYTSPPIAGTENGGGDSWLYRFSTKGVHDLACLPHFPLGMVIRIVVFDSKKDSINDPTFDDWGPLPSPPPPPLAVFANANAVLTDDELTPGNIVNEPDGEVAWADLSL